MPLLRVSEPSLVEELIRDLMASPEVVAHRVDYDLVVLNILGSLNSDAMRLAATLHARAWEEAQRSRGIHVRVDVE